MERKKYELDVYDDNITDYILWAWTGNYLNLGAGLEIGIYKNGLMDKTIGLLIKV